METVGGSSRPNSVVCRKNSLSTIFSSVGDLVPTNTVVADVNDGDTAESESPGNLLITEEKMGEFYRRISSSNPANKQGVNT